MSDWEKLDPKAAVERLGPENVKSAKEHAAETVARSKCLYRSRVTPRGLLTAMYGLVTPVVDMGDDGVVKPLPPSACPNGYTILWAGDKGSDYPPEVDNNVLMKIDQPAGRGQIWMVMDVADAVRIIKSAFGIDVKLPKQEARS